MSFAIQPAAAFPHAELVSLLNQAFEDYFIPIHFTPAMFVNMLEKDGIDLRASRVLLADRGPCGIALLAPRSTRRTSRLAAMGIARDMRGRGAGSWFMKVLIEEACNRLEQHMVLEVIEQNEAAVTLYRKSGFEIVRRLTAYRYSGEPPHEHPAGRPGEIEMADLAAAIARSGAPDLPWQLAGESLVQMQPPLHAYAEGPALAALSNPEAERVVIWSLLVEPAARGQGLATALLKQVTAAWPGKTWHVPALCPEEFGRVFEQAGFERENLSQWQMSLRL